MCGEIGVVGFVNVGLQDQTPVFLRRESRQAIRSRAQRRKSFVRPNVEIQWEAWPSDGTTS